MGLEISYIGGLELEYARLTELIPWLPALQSVPRLAVQLLSVEYNKQPRAAYQGWAGWVSARHRAWGLGAGGACRRASNPKKSRPRLSSVEKTRAAWRGPCYGASGRGVGCRTNQRQKNLPAFSPKMERKDEEVKYGMDLVVAKRNWRILNICTLRSIQFLHKHSELGF